jgi:hypothetical protein
LGIAEKKSSCRKNSVFTEFSMVNYVAQLNGEVKSLPDVLGNTFFSD